MENTIQDNLLAVIADIHGRFDLMENLLAKLKVLYPNARLCFTGDYIDRGPDSFKVVDKLRDLVEHEDAIALAGNHEAFAIDFTREAVKRWKHGDMSPIENSWTQYNGGNKTIESYNLQFNKFGKNHFANQFIESKHYKFLAELPFYYEDDFIFLSHAPVPIDKCIPRFNGTDLWKLSEEVLTWSFVDNIHHEKDFARIHRRDDGSIKLAVCGHIHRLRNNFPHSRQYEHIIYNDSGAGCAPHAPLTAAIIVNGRFKEFVVSDIIDTSKKVS